MNRQDLAGFSSESGPSSYALLGQPGWINTATSGFPNPHPDYFLAVTWKQLIGTTVLKSNYTSSETFDAHVWCSSGKHGLSSDSPVITYINIGDTPIRIEHDFKSSKHTEYIFTSFSPSPSLRKTSTFSSNLPDSLFGDVSFLNGVELKVNSDGTLPQFPLKGNKKDHSLITVPPFSYGFLLFQNDKITACNNDLILAIM